MIYKFKYKLIKNILSKYFDIKELNFNVANENTVVTIDIKNNFNCFLHVNEHEIPFEFEGSMSLVSELNNLKQKFIIAKTMEYLPEDGIALISDGCFDINLKMVSGFGFPVILIGDEDYIIAVPITNEFDDEDIESLVVSFIKYDQERGFPDYKLLKIKVSQEILSSLSFDLMDTELFEI